MIVRLSLIAMLGTALLLWAAGCDSSDGGKTEKEVAADVKTGDGTGVGEDVVVSPADVVETPEVVLEIVPDIDMGPQPPAPKAYSGGTCPTFEAGKNYILTDKRNRSFEMWLPPHPNNPGLVFVWHGNGDTPKNIGLYFLADQISAQENVIVVSPANCCTDSFDDCCDISTTWNMGEYSNTQADLTMFDDILACVEQQYDIDNKRVYTTGFSAGSLWSTFLVVNRGEYFAAAAIFSGGTGLVVDYQTPGSRLPVLLSWGGVQDTYMGVVNFDTMMNDFSAKLRADGHFVVECDHGLGHTIPYGGPTWSYEFILSHTWGDEAHVLESSGLTGGFPAYCTIPQ